MEWARAEKPVPLPVQALDHADRIPHGRRGNSLHHCRSRMQSREVLPSSSIRKKTTSSSQTSWERLRFIRGELHHDADYIRGRRERNVKEESVDLEKLRSR